MITKKVILLGRYGVGKTSLIRQFVHQQFSEQYLTTIGVKIDKKVIEVNGATMTMIIWDIAGEDKMQKVPASYKLGSHGVLYVVDLTRPATYQDLEQELLTIQTLVKNAPILLLGNKSDLLDAQEVQRVTKEIGRDDLILTSAKTGFQVEMAFQALGQKMLQ